MRGRLVLRVAVGGLAELDLTLGVWKEEVGGAEAKGVGGKEGKLPPCSSSEPGFVLGLGDVPLSVSAGVPEVEEGSKVADGAKGLVKTGLSPGGRREEVEGPIGPPKEFPDPFDDLLSGSSELLPILNIC